METESTISRNKYIERINRSLEFIEANLENEISLEDMACAASFSRFHFHRIFSAIVGETPDDYVRRLRLEYAANLFIRCPSMNVTDVAMRTGFSTPALFSRNFKKKFGISPAEWRKSKKRQITSNNRIALIPQSANIKSSEVYKKKVSVKIIRLKPFTVAYIRHLFGYNTGVRRAYQKLFRWLSARGFVQSSKSIIGIPMDNPGITSPDKCRYFAATAVDKSFIPSGEIGKMKIEGGLYAVARFNGPSSGLPGFFAGLYGEWLPDSGYEPADTFTFWIYTEKPAGEKELIHEFDQYIPVKPV